MSWFRRHLSWLSPVALWLGALQVLIAATVASTAADPDPLLARDLAVICSGTITATVLPPGIPGEPRHGDHLRCFLHCSAALSAPPLTPPAYAFTPPPRVTLPAKISPRTASLAPPRIALAGLGSRAPPLI